MIFCIVFWLIIGCDLLQFTGFHDGLYAAAKMHSMTRTLMITGKDSDVVRGHPLLIDRYLFSKNVYILFARYGACNQIINTSIY